MAIHIFSFNLCMEVKRPYGHCQQYGPFSAWQHSIICQAGTVFYFNLVEAQFTLSFQLFASPYACLVNKPASLCTCYCSWQVLYYCDNSFFTTLSAARYYALFLSFGQFTFYH